MPRLASRSSLTPRARLACALKTIWHQVGLVFLFLLVLYVVGLWVNVNVHADVRMEIPRNMTCAIDLDIDIGTDAVDHEYVSARFLLVTRATHIPPPAPSPIKCFSPKSRQRCANWKARQRDRGRARLSQEMGREIYQHESYVLSLILMRTARTSPWRVLTDHRVQNFTWFTLFSLVGLGVW